MAGGYTLYSIIPSEKYIIHILAYIVDHTADLEPGGFIIVG